MTQSSVKSVKRVMKKRERKLEQENEEGTVTDATFITWKYGKFYGPVGSQLLPARNFGKGSLETVKW
jgi:hypothetical protein